MKALTLHQPWATLVASGHKRFETRSWPPPRPAVGERIAIHAGMSFDLHFELPEDIDGLDCPRGAVVCTARLRGAYRIGFVGDGEFLVVEARGADARELARETDCRTDAFGRYGRDRWVWWLDDIVRLDPPAPAKGRQRLWEWRA